LAFFALDFLESALFVAELPDELDFLAAAFDFLLLDEDPLDDEDLLELPAEFFF
jgi:hypothetical protein